MLPKYFLQDDAKDGTEGDGGLSLDNLIGETMDDLGSKIGEGEDKSLEVKDAKGTQDNTEVKDDDLTPPQSWKKEMHPHWTTASKEVRAYWKEREKQFLDGTEQYKSDSAYAKSLRDAIKPYEAILTAQGLTGNDAHVKALQYLFNAHANLSNKDVNARLGFVQKLLSAYNIDSPSLIAALQAAATSAGTEDPLARQTREELDKLTRRIDEQDNARLAEAKAAVDAEVDAFAKDPAHPYFDEVADDIAVFLRGSPTMTLAQAYEKAVWANPAVRAKEQARLEKETEAKLRKDAEEKAAAARRKRGTRVVGQDAEKGPTDPLGTIEDTMRDTYRNIQNRTH